MTPPPAARDLLREMAKDPKGVLILTETYGGVFIETNGRNFTFGATTRDVATWKDALKELVRANYVATTASQGIYEITKSGYDFVDACSSNLVI